MVGQHIGKYRVTQQIGRGGMGTVYAAIDETLHRDVAIKVLNAGLNDPTVARRFRAEAVTVARLNHPGIATIYELVQHDGQWLMVMEFVRGDTLEQAVAEKGPLPVPRAAELTMQALSALDVQRVALATPYDEALTRDAKAGIESYGIEVVSFDWLRNVRSVFDETPARAYRLGRSVDRPEAQAVFFSGVGMPTVSMLQALERDIGKPVISSASAMMWNALCVAGVEPFVPGYGRLLSGGVNWKAL